MKARKIIKEELANGCVIASNYPTRKDGYLVVERGNKTTYLHRYIYEQIYGNIPSGKVIRHTCNNSSCINPEHLACGTQKDNIQDEIIRGTFARGEKNGMAKLTKEKVLKIRKDNIHTYKQLADIYNISPSVAHSVKTGKTWRHL